MVRNGERWETLQKKDFGKIKVKVKRSTVNIYDFNWSLYLKTYYNSYFVFSRVMLFGVSFTLVLLG